VRVVGCPRFELDFGTTSASSRGTMAAPAPSTGFQMPPDENHALALQTVWWTEVAIATVFIGLRFWARSLKRSLGLDDVVMAASWVSFVLFYCLLDCSLILSWLMLMNDYP